MNKLDNSNETNRKHRNAKTFKNNQTWSLQRKQMIQINFECKYIQRKKL